jgi:hypothetical protein
MSSAVGDRFDILTLLSEASELEHGLACCYLYAAFSLKQDLAEGDLTWEQHQKVRLWASQILQVAAEEMFHLAQAWNLLTAIGGSPWYGRPNFPQPSSYYPLHLPLETKPFSLETLDRFIAFEHPADPSQPPLPHEPGDEGPAFQSVGELYALIAQGIRDLPEQTLFLGDPARQVGPDLLDFPSLLRVTDGETALRAIETITEQGEGMPKHREDSHYDIFRNVRASFLKESLSAATSGSAFAPVRPCITNPVAYRHPFLAAPGANQLDDPETAALADTFDSIYVFMLRLLQYVFDNSTSDPQTLQPFSRAALYLMTAVLKPLGETLTLLPAGPRLYGSATAGPPFAIGRQVALPLDPRIAQTIATEKLTQLQQRLANLSDGATKPDQLQNATANLINLNLDRSSP